MIAGRSLSLRNYMLILTFISLSVLSCYAYWSLQQYKALQQEFSQSNLQKAQTELQQAIDSIAATNQISLNRFGEWEEVKQQFTNPKYYRYWHNYRALTGGEIDSNFLDVALYNSDGTILQRLGDRFPLQVDADKRTGFSEVVNNSLELVLFSPITVNSQGSEEVVGYVAGRSNLYIQLLHQSMFHKIDARTLEFETENQQLPISQTAEIFSFAILEDDIYNDLLKQIYDFMLGFGLIIIVLATLSYLFLALLFAMPLSRLSRHIDRLRESPGSMILQTFSQSLPLLELEKVRTSLNQYHTELYDLYEKLDQKSHELRRKANTDSLTSCYNRHAFEEDWKKVADLFSESRMQIALAYIDINHFKMINDTYGHSVGDDVLIIIADTIRPQLRKGEKLYRLGGDEFAVIFYNCSGNDVRAVGERCVEQMALHNFAVLGIKEAVRISVGIATTEGSDPDLLHGLIQQADKAMYRAKKPSEPSVVVYTNNMETIGMTHNINSFATHAVYEVLNGGTGITIYYQPIMHIPSQTVSYYEALLRIRKDDEIVMPGHIFQVIEAKGLEQEMDRLIFQSILADLASAKIPINTGVSINISGQSVTNPEILTWFLPFTEHLRNYKLVLEVTETALIDNMAVANSHLQQLRDMGFLIALDDFGNGYSSLAYLANIPVDIIKFDITLIRCLNSEKQRRIIFHLAAMISESGYAMVAEGIEKSEQCDDIKELGFEYGQGYLFGRPQPEFTLMH